MILRLPQGRARILGAAALALGFAPMAAGESTTTTAPPSPEVRFDLRAFRVVARDSGPVNYYSFVDGKPWPFLHAAYRPPYETMVLGYPIAENLRRSVASLQWKWRAVALPRGGNECAEGQGDSAAVVYVTWRRGFRWYAVKYVWSSVGPKGTTCDRKRNLVRAQDTVIVESGPPLQEWRMVTLSPDVEFRNHFENGDPQAEVPDLLGVGIMSDGDQTQSTSEADYADFVIRPR